MENDAKMHPKWEPKSIPNQKNARKNHAKSMENDAKMHPKMGAKIHPKSKNTGKKGIRKLMPKFNTKKLVFGPCQGVREAVDT